MKTYQYILFDWDGNLAKTLDIWLEACREPLIKRGFDLSDEQIAASFGGFSAHMQEWGVHDPDAVMDEADAIAKQHLPNVELYPDALEVLEALQQEDKKLALITTSPHENVAHLLEKYNMNRLFDALVTYESTVRHKPFPDPLEHALELLGGSKNKAIMIGDSDKNLGAAKNAGIDSILFYSDEHKKFYDFNKLKQLNPTFVIKNFTEIIQIV